MTVSITRTIKEKSAGRAKFALAVGVAMVSLVAAQGAQAYEAYVNQPAPILTGPSPDYPPVVYLHGGEPVEVYGCLDGYQWCDVQFRDYRGWFDADQLSYAYEGRRVPLYDYGYDIGLPIIGFSFNDYWGRYYRDRPFFRERSRFESIPLPRPREDHRGFEGRPGFDRDHGQQGRPEFDRNQGQQGRPEFDRGQGRPDFNRQQFEQQRQQQEQQRAGQEQQRVQQEQQRAGQDQQRIQQEQQRAQFQQQRAGQDQQRAQMEQQRAQQQQMQQQQMQQRAQEQQHMQGTGDHQRFAGPGQAPAPQQPHPQAAPAPAPAAAPQAHPEGGHPGGGRGDHPHDQDNK